MAPGSPLLALRFGDSSHALEPDRDYLLGSADDCDLRLPGAEPHHARLMVVTGTVTIIDLGSDSGLLHNEERASTATLQVGDRIAIAGELIVVVADDGTATMVPIPAMRRAAHARRIKQVRISATALRRPQEDTFSQLIAGELRRAPWMMISLVLHMLLVLMLWWFVPTQQISGMSLATLGIDVAAAAPLGQGLPGPPEVVAEQDDDQILEDPDQLIEPQRVPDTEGPEPERKQPAENPTLAKRKRPSNRGNGKNVVRNELGVGSGSFTKAVEELQESGLEIVFVFDSTGSMTRTIHDTKTTIVQMLDVLRTLVPDARIGLVTYRDRSRREEYLVRQVPLDIDYWRASNFVQFITAEGGGDRPEDVRAGLNAAFQQDWRTGARRVVVLAGDAPAHHNDFSRLLKEVGQFARNRRSFVHTLITSPDRAGTDTAAQFQRIAQAGRGTCEPIQNRTRVLQRVLTLAFGREFDDDIEAVIHAVDKERNRVNVESLHIVRRGGDDLARALKRRPVPTALWNALVRRPRRPVAETLLDLLADKRTPPHTRHASAAALQRIFKLPVPPIDTVRNEPPSGHRLLRLRTLAQQLPN